MIYTSEYITINQPCDIRYLRFERRTPPPLEPQRSPVYCTYLFVYLWYCLIRPDSRGLRAGCIAFIYSCKSCTCLMCLPSLHTDNLHDISQWHDRHDDEVVSYVDQDMLLIMFIHGVFLLWFKLDMIRGLLWLEDMIALTHTRTHTHTHTHTRTHKHNISELAKYLSI